MVNKTAATMLKEYFEQQLSLQRESKIKYTTEEALVDAIDVCKNAIEVERRHIIAAANWDSKSIGENGVALGEKYYETTYQNK